MKKIYHRDALQCIFDVDNAVDILEEYKNEELENEISDKPLYERKQEISQKKFAIESLEEWIIDKAFEAPVVKNIEKFIYQMNYYSTLYDEDTKGYLLFCNMRDTADKVVGFFL